MSDRNNLNSITDLPSLSFSRPDPNQRHRLPAGRYLVIDPCYVFGEPDELWSRICDEFYPNRSCEFTTLGMTIGSHTVFMWSTAYGDGSYPVFVNGVEVGSCGVDAGLLCFIPEALVKELDGDDGLGVYVDLPEDADLSLGEGDRSRNPDRPGDAKVGLIYVCTCGCMTEDDEGYADDDDEEDWLYDDEDEDEFDDEEA